MAELTASHLRKQIDSGNLDPVYLVLGDDDYEKAEVADEFEATIDEELRPFNVTRFYGDESSLGDILEASRTLPMMAQRRLVIVIRSERLLQPKRESQASIRALEDFNLYLRNPAPTTTLVIVAGTLDKRSKIYKSLMKSSTLTRLGVLADSGDAERWIRSQVKAKGVDVEVEAIRLLANIVGPDIRRLRADLDRLLLFAAHQERVTVDDVRVVVGPPTSQDDWAVTKAIQNGATDRALRELGLALDGGAVPYMVLGQLAWVARERLGGRRAKPAIEAVFRTDYAMKQSRGEPRILLERLVVQLCG